MDVPKIIVFVNEKPTPFQDRLLVELNRRGYAPMVDSVHATSYDWFVKNVQSTPHKLFVANDECKEFLFYEINQLDSEIMFAPDMLIYYNEDYVCEPSSWTFVKHWFQFLMFQTDKTELVEKGELIMKKPHTEVLKEMEDVEMEKDDQKQSYYSFRYEHLEEDDIMLFEVCKPYTDLPYTSVVRTFSLTGPKAFFPSLYVCTSWGVSRYDLSFLKHLWETEFHFDPKDFDMEMMLKEATEACYPSPGMIPESEPEVYRRTIENVKETLASKKTGKLCGGDCNEKDLFWKRVQEINKEAKTAGSI